MKFSIACLFVASSLLFTTVLAHAENTIDYSFVCSEKLRQVSQRSFKPAICNSVGAISAGFATLDGKKLKTKEKDCIDGKEECLEKLNSQKFKNRLKKAKLACEESGSKPPFTCALSSDVISDCVDQIVAAMKRIAPYSCETIVNSSQAQKRLSKVHPSCELIKKTCPDIVEELSISNL